MSIRHNERGQTVPSSSHATTIIACSCFFLGLCGSTSSGLLSSSDFTAASAQQMADRTRDGFAIATYVGNHDQQQHAAALIKSIRAFGGSFSQSPIYVVLADPDNLPCRELVSERVTVLPANVDRGVLAYPLAIKAFAAAQVEKLLGKSNGTLAWFDPETIVLGPLDDLDLRENEAAALRPVFLVNAIGLPPDAEPNAYWAPLYSALKLDPARVPVVETVVDGKQVKAYYNCGIFSVRPRLGILQEWARQLAPLLQNVEYQKTACPTFVQRLFLHQAVFSAVVVSKVAANDIRPLPMRCGYPLNLHERLSAEKRAKSLNALSSAIIDELWRQNPHWMDIIPVDEPLRSWLVGAYSDFLKIGHNIYRIEGSCNSYLVTTKAGSVLIDPAGANGAPEWFSAIIQKHPLKAILLTHAHNDHRDSITIWRKDSRIPVIAQRSHVELLRYQDRLAGFFARRNAIWARKPLPLDTNNSVQTPIEATVLFTDTYTFAIGGTHFTMIHTPGETPDHATIWIPELEAVFVGDNYYEYFINNATLRGTMTRPVLGYIRALDTALSHHPRFFLMGHGSPIIGRHNINQTVTTYRNALQHLHDATVEGLNEGKDVFTLMEQVKLPPQAGIPEYFGKSEWTVRGICEEYTGWFDGNPATMYSQPVASVYADLVHLSGGAGALARRAEEILKEGEFVRVLHLTEIALSQDPRNQQVLALRLSALRSLRKSSRNYIENIWLDYGIRCAQEKLSEK